MDEAVLLLTWWALWTLADTYLIRFTPYSELVVLTVAGVLRVVPACARRVRACRDRGREVLKETLDTV
jgi:hypothetical protein